jgi:glutathione gamma-glutamylcysteinyltransferase
LSKISVYKRIPNNLGIPFQSSKSQTFLKECIEEGNSVAFFDIIDQFQTQSDPTFCGPTTLIIILNSLGIDPNKKWKG